MLQKLICYLQQIELVEFQDYQIYQRFFSVIRVSKSESAAGTTPGTAGISLAAKEAVILAAFRAVIKFTKVLIPNLAKSTVKVTPFKTLDI